jgi:hypothetical protein
LYYRLAESADNILNWLRVALQQRLIPGHYRAGGRRRVIAPCSLPERPRAGYQLDSASYFAFSASPRSVTIGAARLTPLTVLGTTIDYVEDRT